MPLKQEHITELVMEVDAKVHYLSLIQEKNPELYAKALAFLKKEGRLMEGGFDQVLAPSPKRKTVRKTVRKTRARKSALLESSKHYLGAATEEENCNRNLPPSIEGISLEIAQELGRVSDKNLSEETGIPVETLQSWRCALRCPSKGKAAKEGQVKTFKEFDALKAGADKGEVSSLVRMIWEDHHGR